MIRHMRHGSPPRLMALQPICVLTSRESPADPISRSPYDFQDRFRRDSDLLMPFRHTPQGSSLPKTHASWASIWGMSIHPLQPEERACTVAIFGPKACRPARALPLIPGADLFSARCMLVHSTPSRHRDGSSTSPS